MNNFRFLSRFLACVLFFSCSQTAEKINPNIYHPEKFKELMIEFHITEAALSMNPAITDSSAITAFHSYKEILERHETTKEIFLENLNHYSSRPDDFLPVMEAVIDSLNVLNLSLK